MASGTPTTPGNPDAAAAGFLSLKSQFGTVLQQTGVTGKAWSATETGAPRHAVGGMPGDDYAKNYVMKVMARAQLAGMIGVDWLDLSDSAAEGASTDSDSYMGLYDDIAALISTSMALRTDTGVAYSTLGKLLKGAKADEATTASLHLSSGVSGGAFVTAAGHRAYALWATGASGEAGAATYALASPAGVTAYAWDYATTNASQTLASNGRHVALPLTSSVQVFVAN